MGRLHTLAAGTALLALGVKAQFSYQYCAALDTSTIKKTTELYPQGPAACLAYCNGIGYSYAGLQAQFCSCWDFSPVVTKKYDDSAHADCSFNCDDPYSNQYCGGIDLSTLGFLYSLYAGVAPPIVGGSPSSTAVGAIGTSSGGVIISPPATSSSGGGGVIPASSSSAGGVIVIPPQSSSSPGGGLPTLPSTSAGQVLPPTSSGLAPPGPSGVSPPASSGPSGVLPPASSGPSGGVGPSGPGPSGGIPPQSSLPSGVIVPTATGSSPAGSGTPSPSSTGAGGAPIQTIVVLSRGQPFVITIAPYLRARGDQALSWIPSPPWFLYNANITSFYGTVPLDYPVGPLIITVTAGQRTTGSNGLGGRQVPAGTYTFAIQLVIVAIGPVPTLPTSRVPTPSLPTPSLPGLPSGPLSSGAVLPSYTNTVYQTITSTITRCPVCPPEVTKFAVPIGTTCITAEVFTTPCEITVTRTRAGGVVTPVVTTTNSWIPYNPAESTIVVKTVDAVTTKYTTTLLVAVTMTVEKLQPTGQAGAVQPPPPPPPPPAPPGPPGPPGVPAAAPVPGAPFPGPVAPPPPNGAIGTGAANNGSQPAPTMPVTAGASMDRLVEMFVLLCGVAFGALLLL